MSKKMKTKAGNPIVMIPVELDMVSKDGTPFIKPDQIPVALVKGRDGVVYSIPVDKKTGKVPESALFERFVNIDEGSRNGHQRNIAIDLSDYALKMHTQPKGGFTPEELIRLGWWQHPNESDIMGVDDPSTQIITIMEGMSKSGQEAGKKIAVLTSPESKQMIEKVLKDNFTGSELKRVVKDRGIVITESRNLPRGVGGYYLGRQPGVDVPKIVIRPNSSEDTITHEFVHHARQTDKTRKGVSRTLYPMTEDDRKDPYMAAFIGKENLTNLEEAATVAEAAIRTRKPAVACGYFVDIDGGRNTLESCQKAYDHDRDVLTKNKKGENKPKRGRNAEKAINARFKDTQIATLRVDHKGKKAISVYEQYKDELEKPLVQDKPKTPANATGATTGRGMAEAGRVPKTKNASKSVSKKSAKAPAKKPQTASKSYKYAVDSKGKRHRIPVNKDGSVSKRFLNEQAKKGAKNLNMDKKRTSKTVLPSNPTPQMAYDWSKNVSNMDVNGLDAPEKARISYKEKRR